MQTELRILNGLHRGGILPLDESTLLIGSNEDADVVLVSLPAPMQITERSDE